MAYLTQWRLKLGAENYNYRDTLAASQKIGWRIEDIIGGDKKLDFTKPFLPEALARGEGPSFLTSDERRTLNQIRGNTYLCIFGLVEEFILPFVLDHARPQLQGDDYRVRACCSSPARRPSTSICSSGSGRSSSVDSAAPAR